MEIPATLHQTGPDGALPAAYRPEWRQSWREAHPGWSYHCWRDSDLLALARDHYPELVPVFADAAMPGVVKGDFGRLMVLDRFGGVYADLDAACLQPLAPILAGRPVVLSEMARRAVPIGSPHWHRHVHNAMMAAVPGHPLIRSILDAGLAAWRAGKHKSPEMIAGPQTVRNCLRLYGGADLYVSPPAELCPLSWLVVSESERLRYAGMSVDELRVAFPGAYAVTFWIHNW